MKHLPTTLALICAALTATLPLVAESLRDAVAEAEIFILQKYKTPKALELAEKDLNKILESDMTEEEKIAAIRAEFSSASSPSLPIQDKTAQSDNLADLIFRPPLQWQIQSIKIAYDLDSVTNILLSAESLYQEGKSNSREDTKSESDGTRTNAGAKMQLDLDVGGNIDIKGWNPLNWFQAKAGFQWVTSGNAGIDYTKTESSQWNERAQRALSNNYEEKARILQDTRITKCHLTFYVLFKNNTDKDLLLDPQEFSIPVYAGANRPLADAVPDTRLRSFRIPRNAYSDLKFRAELNTTSALDLINYMRSNEPMIRLDRAQSTIASTDGSIQDAVQDSLQVETVPFRCRDFELQIKKNNQGKTTTVADAMRALNSVFEKAPFGFNQVGDCFLLIDVPLVKNVGKDMDIHRIPIIGFNGRFTSEIIPATQLNRPLSEAGILVDVLDAMDKETWNNSLPQLQAYLISFMKLAAESGDALAQNRLGLCYHCGDGVRKDDSEAAKWYWKAAEQGLVVAQCNLGLLFYENKRYSEAAPLLRKAAEQNNNNAQYWIGVCYERGYGVNKNINEAMKWFQKSAEQGNLGAQYKLGALYEENRNYDEAGKWYYIAAERGDDRAQYSLGRLYVIHQNPSEAMKWYRLAAEQGNIDAQLRLALIYEYGNDITKDMSEAAKWYRKAAEQGNDEAQFNIGTYYREGKGVGKDLSESVKWFRKAAEQGNVDAQFWLAVSYADGEGVNQDYVEAVKWYRKAAEQDHYTAQNNLGLIYQKGRPGVSKNLTEAIKWYQKAAGKGNRISDYNLGTAYDEINNPQEAIKWIRMAADRDLPEACCKLGIYYAEGKAVSQNYTEAMKWFRKAAEQGNAVAQTWIGSFYEDGTGVSRDKNEAAKWFRMAANQGNEYAKEALNRLGN